MELLHPRCCGLDVHKKTLTACVLIREGEQAYKEVRTYATHTQDLRTLRDWLKQMGVTHVGMEATGVYWKPVWHVLEGHSQLRLANARFIKNVPGRKTDVKDSEWIAELLQHGLLPASFVPAQPQQALRNLTRYRAKLLGERSSVTQRTQKLLEDANIKLSSVATDILGVSGRAMLEALGRGQSHAEQLAQMARGRLKGKQEELVLALEGNLTEHHRDLLKELLRHWDFLSRQVEAVDQEIQQRVRPFQELIQRWEAIPGCGKTTAWVLLAEVGTRAEQFSDAAHLASGAGLCPGNYESAGKRRSGKMREGNPWVRRALCQAAWAASRTRGTYLAAQYHRLVPHRGKKRAIMAVAHSILGIAYQMLKTGASFVDLGGDYFQQRNAEALRRRAVKTLEEIGYQVALTKAA